MPRDDLSIDMTKNMRLPVSDQMDASAIIEEWMLRASNIPGETSFTFTEIEAKDREIAECKAIADELDAKLQKFIKTHGALHPNSKEESWRAQIHEKQHQCETLSREKIELLNNLTRNFDKHLRTLDFQIKSLYDRGEPSFEDPDELPSLVRPSAANSTSRQASVAPSRFSGASALSCLSTGMSAHGTIAPIIQAVSQGLNKSTALNSQLRLTQSAQNYASSAPATPTAAINLSRSQRESSAGPAVGSIPKRPPRQPSSLGVSMRTIPSGSGLTRQPSLGPGTPKVGPLAIGTGPPSQSSRAGSVDLKTSSSSSIKGTGPRKSLTGTPTGTARKRPPVNKSGLLRGKGARLKKSPGSNADSEVSEAESESGEDDGRSRGTSRPAAVVHDRPPGSLHNSIMLGKRDADGDVDMEDEEGNDDKRYCLCQNVSFGDMVACDNDDCPYEWFHWNCVGLKSEPTGRWYCPICRENKSKKLK